MTDFSAFLKKVAAGDITDDDLRELAEMPAMHPVGCGCISCASSTFSYSPQYDQSPNPLRGRILHKIGRATLSVQVYRKQKIYDVQWDGVLIASSRHWPQDALRKARSRVPKPSKRVIGEILAYRGWNLIGDILQPLTRGQDYESWEGPVAVVSDFNPDDTNGLYAVKIEHSRDLLRSYRPLVHGIVGLSGKVVEYERGYRAQKQIVRVLRVVPPVGDVIIKALEERYQCQVFRQKKR